MLNLDAIVLSHTYMDAEVPDGEQVSRYLPPYRPLWKLDPRLPVTHGSVVFPSDFSETRQSMQEGQENARAMVRRAASEFTEIFGRWHGDLVEGYRLEDAEHVIVAMGSLAAESRVAVDGLREDGHKAGVLRVRFFRPFPLDELRELCKGRKGLLVIDRDFSYGMEGALFTEVKSALFGHVSAPVKNLIVGIGGRDVTYELIAEMTLKAARGELDDVTWGDSHVTEAHRITMECIDEFKMILDN
jgi:pyruvate/2-oxoacid:ferredoxin oxidoreductase alpha subunit